MNEVKKQLETLFLPLKFILKGGALIFQPQIQPDSTKKNLEMVEIYGEDEIEYARVLFEDKLDERFVEWTILYMKSGRHGTIFNYCYSYNVTIIEASGNGVEPIYMFIEVKLDDTFDNSTIEFDSDSSLIELIMDHDTPHELAHQYRKTAKMKTLVLPKSCFGYEYRGKCEEWKIRHENREAPIINKNNF